MFAIEKIVPKKIVFRLSHDNGLFRTWYIETENDWSMQAFKRTKNGNCYLDIHSGFVDVVDAKSAKKWLKTHCYKITRGNGSHSCTFAYTDEHGFIQGFGKRDETLPQVEVNLC